MDGKDRMDSLHLAARNAAAPADQSMMSMASITSIMSI